MMSRASKCQRTGWRQRSVGWRSPLISRRFLKPLRPRSRVLSGVAGFSRFWAGNCDGERRGREGFRLTLRRCNVACYLDVLFGFSLNAFGVVVVTEFFGGVVAVFLQRMDLAADAANRGN